jgi:hypothetical protein
MKPHEFGVGVILLAALAFLFGVQTKRMNRIQARLDVLAPLIEAIEAEVSAPTPKPQEPTKSGNVVR